MLEKYSLLIGKWKGNGTACFPTIETTCYIEELEFKLIGDDESIMFEQKTWHIDNSKSDSKGDPLHWESGFIIAYPNGTLELFNAQNSKRVEVMKSIEISIDDLKLQLSFESKFFGNDERMLKTSRGFFVDENSLHYVVRMSTQNTHEFQKHLEAKLFRL